MAVIGYTGYRKGEGIYVFTRPERERGNSYTEKNWYVKPFLHHVNKNTSKPVSIDWTFSLLGWHKDHCHSSCACNRNSGKAGRGTVENVLVTEGVQPRR